MGELSFFLGIEAIQSDHGLYLSQRCYILDLLIRSKMDKAKPCVTPMLTSQSLIKFACIPFHDPHLYRSVVGGLQYLSFTQPDLAFAVHKVSKYMQNPMEPHWAVVKRILRYLNTISHALLIQPTTDLKLHTFSDADWASDHGDRSTEVEYKALANAATKIQWIKYLLTNLCVPIAHSLILWCDNIGATYLASNPLFHARTKHIEIDFHYVHDQVLRGQLHVQFVSTKDQYADALTKPLTSSRLSLTLIVNGRLERDGTTVVGSIK
ncbi:Retrovirus-related Pol polyprotein from transposon RE2 [Vitis vinifera]|uniref:Retrovirus-related Pol polyprotein from transposon RE2 n=1 Tax=Vitis vinifera TaxID=29760 RepID=A0A438G8E6_VITVI|nr:Retrovirus-related Pol polyprotein from transposon RE2 [Vitis vinifera]